MNAPDPSNLRTSASPALLEIEGEVTKQFVADTTILENGWLRTSDWEGNVVVLPPSQILAVRRVETERYDDELDNGTRKRRIVDEELREKATTDDNEGEKPLIADD